MKKEKKQKVAAEPTQSPAGATIVATIAKGAILAVAATPLVPAILINLDQAAGKGVAWTAFAIGSVLAAAVAVEMVREMHGVASKALWCLIAALFLSLNIMNAIGNSASHSDDLRDVRSSQKQQSSQLSQQLSQLSQRRTSLAAVASEATPESIEAEIQAAKAADARKWNSSGECDVSRITRGPTQTFCEGISRLQAKLSAARKRDELDQQIASLNSRTGGVVPSTADPQAESLALFVSAWGFEVSEKGKTVIASSLDWGKGIGVEVLAAFLPAGLLAMLSKLGEKRDAPEPQTRAKGRAKRKELAEEPAVEAAAHEVSGDPEIDAFHAKRLDAMQGEFISTSDVYAVWVAYCAERGIEPGSKKSFSVRLQKRVQYDRNNGRPRFCHIKLRDNSKPQLRVVSRGA